MESITNLLRALAEAIRPYLGLDDNGGAAVVEAIEGLDDHIEEVVRRYNRANDIAALDPADIEGLDEVVEEAVESYMSNDSSILTSSSFDPDDYGLLTNDDFDPSNYDLLDATDTEYLIDTKLESEVGARVEAAVEEAMEDALVVQPAGLYSSEEFLAAVEAAVRATLVGTTWTVQANVEGV
jgi:hypothetical protein|tara:strand:+ start:988 stop:1533 length:546 start_codon:yes stop_codon:yes gene_type:complete